MDGKQAKEVSNKLKGVFQNSNHWGMTVFYQEWTKNLLTLNYSKALKAVDIAIKTCKYCPNIAEFNEIYNNVKIETEEAKIDCKICNGIGVYLLTKVIEGLPYQFAAYCDKCSAGSRFKYDGRIHSGERKSDFYTKSISEYAGMLEASMNEQKESKEYMDENIKKLTNKFNMPEVKCYEQRIFDRTINKNAGSKAFE